MFIIKAALIGAAVLATAGQYYREVRRLNAIKEMPGPRARDYYEATRERGERVMVLVAAALAVIAGGVVGHAYLVQP